MNIDKILQYALQLHNAGDLTQANIFYNEILAVQMDHPDANHLSGLVDLSNGNLDEAKIKIELAIASASSEATFHNSLANVLKSQNSLELAKESYLLAIELDPNLPEAHYNLGKLFERLGDIKSATKCLTVANGLNPRSYENNFSLARLLMKSSQFSDAIHYFKQAISINPKRAEAYNGFAFAQEKDGHLGEAIKNYEHALTIDQNDVATISNLGNALHSIGRVGEAVTHLRKCLELDPNNLLTWDRYLFALIFDEASDQNLIYQENCRWADLIKREIKLTDRHFNKVNNPHKKIKIGYFSKEFYSHVSTFFFETLLQYHDRTNFEIFCYSDCIHADDTTKVLAEKSDFWRDVTGLSQPETCRKIEADDIDIFVGTTNFLASNRIILAHQPAPILVSYMNQVSTTGLLNVDYLITDERLSPSGISENYFTEDLIRLDDFISYRPPPQDVKMAPPPVLKNGYITFGCFNNLAKINQIVISTWAEILQRVQNSKLFLVSRGFNDPSVRTRFTNLFADKGIANDRVQFGGVVNGREDYLNQYNFVDIGLDTFPFSGGTVSDETLYMSVPLITLIGGWEMGRMSESKLSRLQLNDLIAKSTEDYIDLAENLANDAERIADLKLKIRDQAQSTIFNGKNHVIELEQAYRLMWQQYCASNLDGKSHGIP